MLGFELDGGTGARALPVVYRPVIAAGMQNMMICRFYNLYAELFAKRHWYWSVIDPVEPEAAYWSQSRYYKEELIYIE